MNNHFFTDHWARPQSSRRPYYYPPSPPAQFFPVHQPVQLDPYDYFTPAVQPIPVHQPTSRPVPQPAQQHSPARPAKIPSPALAKIVQIPVHYVTSEPNRPVRSSPEPARPEPSLSASAVKIQKAFRGFLVRKNMKKIKSIKIEVDEIEKRIKGSDFVELVRRDERERLRINESLMGLLFKLDSVRGIYSGVRDCRKAVIKKAIALQEQVDAIVAASNDQIEPEIDSNSNSNLIAEVDSDQSENVMKSIKEDVGDGNCEPEERSEEPVELEIEEFEEIGEKSEGEDEGAAEAEEAQGGNEAVMVAEEQGCGGEDERVVGAKAVEVEGGDEAEMAAEEGGWEGTGATQKLEKAMEDVVEENNDDDDEGEGVEDMKEGGEEENERSNRELMERMMEDNEKMMSLMTQLFERTEMQTRLLNSLAQRVEQLEKAFMCDKMRRKKKKHQ